MAAKITGNATLDKIIGKINKDFSREFISPRPIAEQVETIPTGSLSLDCAIGGGLPKGKIVELYGMESCGKTSLTLYWAAQAQKIDTKRYVLIVDKEHAMTNKFITGFGIDPDRVIYSRPDTTAEALDSVLALVRSGEICYLGFDSIGALAPPNAVEKSTIDANVGGVAKILVNFFTEYNQVADAAGCTSVFVNQMRYNPAKMFGSPETTPGGTALKFFAHLRLRASEAKPSAKTPNAFTVGLKIKKNKSRAPVDRSIGFDFIYARGPDPIMDILNAGKDLGVLAFAGPNLKMRDGDKEVILCGGGATGFNELVEKDPSVLDKISKACLEKANKDDFGLTSEEASQTEGG
jgi:recombination protein RecA